MAEGAKEAQSRKEELEGEIRHNLHDSVGHGREQEPLVDDLSGELNENDEERFEEYGDDHWSKETERWHNQTGIF